jgi:hypothetical protein
MYIHIYMHIYIYIYIYIYIGGIEDTPFVTITVTIDAADSTKRIVSAYQVTKQCMEMAAEGI